MSKRSKFLDSDSEDDFEKDFKAKKEKKQDRSEPGSSKKKDPSKKIETRKTTKTIDHDLMLAIELSKREAEADAKKRELKESNSATKIEQMKVKDLVNKLDDDFQPPNTNKITTNENKSANTRDKSIDDSNKKSEPTQNQEVTPTADAIQIFKNTIVSSKSTKLHKKTIQSESEEESSFDDNEEDLSNEDFKKRKGKLAGNKKNDTKANLNKNSESNNATLLASINDTCKQNSKIETPSNKENIAQKLESNCSNLNKTLPEYNTINSMKPTKRNERSLVEFAGRPLSNCPLGRIELKTQSSVLRLGLSRNSRPKPLHPNAKPTQN